MQLKTSFFSTFLSVTIIGSIVNFYSTNFALATLLPDQYSFLNEANLLWGQDQEKVDDGLASFIKKISDQHHIVFEGNPKKQGRLEGLDKAHMAVVALEEFKNRKLSQAGLSQRLSGIDRFLMDYRKRHKRRHYFEPYIVSEFRNSKTKLRSSEMMKKLASAFGSGNSCPEIQMLREKVHHKSIARVSDSAIKRTFHRVLDLGDTGVKVRLLQKLENNLLSKQRAMLHKYAATYVGADLSTFKKLNQFVQEAVVQGPNIEWKKALSGLASSRKCSASVEILQTVISREKIPYTELALASEEIANCFRKFGRGSRLKGISTIVARLRPVLGKKVSILEASLKARHYWGENKYDRAWSFVRAAIEKTAQMKLGAEYTEWALFISGLIHENKGQFREAAKIFESYLESFPDSQRSRDVRKANILVSAQIGDWKRVEEASNEIIRYQQMLHQDDRDVSYIGFALFWGGRASLHLGELPDMQVKWKRLSREYYSTYYGALAHYLLQNALDVRVPMQPQVNREFDPQLLSSFSKESGKESFLRSLAFLKLGITSKANCEIKNIQGSKLEAYDHVAKALLFHGSGDWLNAVRSFVKIPRSVRRILPRGFERILFPVRFGNKIDMYSERLGIDPDYVTSLIRQESLFNPDAKSGANAYGVTQVIKSTARLEIKRMSKAYLGKFDRKSLLQKTRNRRGLFDVEVNLAIGVHHLYSLMKKSKNVVNTLASYNAGPTKVRKWKQRYSDRDPLIFIENIPYDETRTYVKLILRNYFYYKKFYRADLTNLTHLDQVAAPILEKIEMAKQRTQG